MKSLQEVSNEYKPILWNSALMEKLASSLPIDHEALSKCKRELLNLGKIPKWHEKVLCKVFGHSEFINIVHYNDVNNEDSKVIWKACKRCGMK